jgi:3-oxoacyl-[acyl-carrier-protein] synthase II
LKRRVVITGVGLVTPLGVGIDNVWKRIINGESGIAPLTRFDNTQHDTKIAGEVKDFKAAEYMSPKELKRIDLFIQYALAATKIAMDDSGLDIPKEDPERAGVIVGTGLGGLPTLEKYHSI